MTSWNPPVGFDFETARPASGDGTRSISLSGFQVSLAGLDAETEAFVAKRFRRYLSSDLIPPVPLSLAFRSEPDAPYLDSPDPNGPAENYRMEHAVRDGRLYYATGTTCACVDIGSGVGIVLTRERAGALARTDPVHLATENLLRACLAWVVLLRGGFVLHAASVVRNGGCYLFFGNSGAGKSTIASICGGQVISDDLTLNLPQGPGFAAIGSPFRGTYTACEDLTDRYPVVGAFRLRKDTVPSVRPIDRARGFADFVANLPFVVGELGHHPQAWSLIATVFAKLSLFELRFRKDDSFWHEIDALHLTSGNDPR
ncbi:MAG TPA: hypothetical protein VGS03_20275 [Candidatus Polarisedimenticolia bacterium]|jgi:hypothetical protein|nr:hypothetical protein [Candidatus Polarisedimenticolia bacterium]